jgi:ABC-type uncharacterized transport system substrate-binding protein
MRRRQFIVGFGGAAIAFPLAARAQRAAIPVIGWLGSAERKGQAPHIAAFIEGLSETGYVEGSNVALIYRWAEDQLDRLPALAADLVRQRVTIILANAPPAAVAAKAATSTIPIVFVVGFDPVAAGLVNSLNKPRGNLTGMSLHINNLVAKKLEILTELMPKSAVIGLIIHPKSPTAATDVREVQAAATRLGRSVRVFNADSIAGLELAFDEMVRAQIGGALIGTDALFVTGQDRLISLETRFKIPLLHYSREFPVAGGLMSYGSNLGSLFKQAGIYSGRILRGAKPAELPVMLPTKFELVINLKAAKTLGLELSPTLLARADEVIE